MIERNIVVRNMVEGTSEQVDPYTSVIFGAGEATITVSFDNDGNLTARTGYHLITIQPRAANTVHLNLEKP